MGAASKRTLDTQHSQQIAKFQAQKAKLRELEEELARLTELLHTTPTQSDDFIEMTDRRAVLVREVQNIRSCRDELNYYKKTADIIFRYYDIVDHPVAPLVVAAPGGGKADTAASRKKPSLAASVDGGATATGYRLQRERYASRPSCSRQAPPLQQHTSILHFLTRCEQVGTTTSSSTTSILTNSPPPTAHQGTTAHCRQQSLESLDPTRQEGKASPEEASLLPPRQYHKDDRATLLRRYMTFTAPMTFSEGGLRGSGGPCWLGDELHQPPAVGTGMSGVGQGRAAAGGHRCDVHPQTMPCETCKHCGGSSRSMVITEGMSYCNDCGTVEYLVIDHDKPSFKEPPKEISYFAYKRINHFNEWLNQIQGKETTDIPDEVFDKILMEIQKERITNIADVGPAKLKDILRRLRLNKYYEHGPYIINKLNGATMPHMPPELEEQLRNMFKQVQVPFLKHAPSKRRNFLSYSFCIYKFLQLLERDEYLKYFPLLKSREKLQVQDNIFKKICEDLNWHFIKSL
jgi:hypothetical protein